MDRRKAATALLQPADLALGAALKLASRRGPSNEGSSAAYQAVARILRLQLKLLNELEVEKDRNVPDMGPVILASNHQSLLDYPVIAASSPRRVQISCSSEHHDAPLIRRIVRISQQDLGYPGPLPISQALKSGRAVAMFPEGTIPGEEIPRHHVHPRTGLLPGKEDVVRIAIRHKVPIVPVGISGTGKAFPPEIYPRLELLRLPSRSPVRVRFGRPIILSSYKEADLTDDLASTLTEEVMESISRLVDHRNNFIPLEVPTPPLSRYESLGVLLIHGFTSSTDAVDGLLPHLEQAGIPYERPILRGHGTRYQDLRGVTSRDWYNDAEQALLSLSEQVDRVAVVGLSMGGLVAIDLASRHPDKIAALVTVAAALKFKDPLAPLAPVLARAVRYWPSPPSFQDPDLARHCTNYPKFPTDAFVSLYRYSRQIEKKLPDVHVPALILAARRDQSISPEAALTIYEKIGSRIRELTWFERSGHEMLQDLEAAAVYERIMGFVQRFHASKKA